MAKPRLTIENGLFRDDHGRQVTLRGINMAGDAKYPSNPHQPSHVPQDFFDGDTVNFHSRPFPLEDAHLHYSRLKRWGYNTIRYVFTWEAIEAAGPGIYDEEWIQHTIEILRLGRSYGFYIFMDPHQDVWSRFSGGSGAPMWTLYACGLNPQSFAATESALVHNTYPEPQNFPKMIWSTNYHRLACQTMFTLFFAGRDFAPKCIIDDKNIQDYLQDHFINALAHLAKRIHEAGDLEDEIVIGWESLNEPNRGFVGWPDLSSIPSEQKLQKGTSPTAWQAILTGSGRACEIDTWDFGGMGPYKSGRVLVDPQGESTWLPANYDESRYGYKRDPGWKLGECIWAQHGVWDPATDTLLKRGYFKKNPWTGEVIDYEHFTNTYFMDYYRKHRDAIRNHHKDCILFCQPPVLEVPPSIKGTEDDDPKMVYAPHYYDGVTLMTKKWNRYWNVDVLGVLRGRYLAPAFAVKIGETAIRNCFRDQLSAIRKEGLDYMGNHPCVLTEFGIPYDMDDKHAYKTGDYSSQSGAMDANHFALEVNPGNIKAKLSTPSISPNPTDMPAELTNAPGYRAAEAYVRPSPIHTVGKILEYGFDLRNCIFSLSFDAHRPSTEEKPTEIFLPEFHFPKDMCEVVVSAGKWEISVDDEDGGMIQRLRWWHVEGVHKIKVIGVMRRQNVALGKEEEGYLDQCQQSKCAVM
ncbi:putative glycosyl hydrolase [Drepanopeziza brunnea f. sp. 'multigermtubi' MB_m1]|uniref:Putative glycosyl hydrolase n=1 Tax=Marssonina brunnea f. sp. multigermtubi (strain MB_m1) TaxID=1072389 RepID=K1X0R5_MARBU|nr:putative glycosyl hydrolase [Drepanopeziza brunnea f. sp. 'multigermtubi' MB_m1]EKD18776.1 putative glycosyl hydrolase [Drepanopeziza brunnea f. sp. 'multigermtubi' MB_m1]